MLLGEEDNGLFLAYTQKSNWAAYDQSAYFRDHDFNPEIFYSLTLWDSLKLSLGAEHQSNGAGSSNEVSWNRGYLDIKFQGKYGHIRVKPWVRFNDKNDYNPDIEDFLGHGELEVAFRITENSELKILTRNTFKKEYYLVDLKFPIYQGFNGYLKYENGYGTTISNYNFNTETYGIGLLFDI